MITKQLICSTTTTPAKRNMLWIGVLVLLGGLRNATAMDASSVDPVVTTDENTTSISDLNSTHTTTAVSPSPPVLLPVLVSRPAPPAMETTTPRAKLHYALEADEWISPKVWAPVTAICIAVTFVIVYYFGVEAFVYVYCLSMQVGCSLQDRLFVFLNHQQVDGQSGATSTIQSGGAAGQAGQSARRAPVCGVRRPAEALATSESTRGDRRGGRGAGRE